MADRCPLGSLPGPQGALDSCECTWDNATGTNRTCGGCPTCEGGGTGGSGGTGGGNCYTFHDPPPSIEDYFREHGPPPRGFAKTQAVNDWYRGLKPFFKPPGFGGGGFGGGGGGGTVVCDPPPSGGSDEECKDDGDGECDLVQSSASITNPNYNDDVDEAHTAVVDTTINLSGLSAGVVIKRAQLQYAFQMSAQSIQVTDNGGNGSVSAQPLTIKIVWNAAGVKHLNAHVGSWAPLHITMSVQTRINEVGFSCLIWTCDEGA